MTVEPVEPDPGILGLEPQALPGQSGSTTVVRVPKDSPVELEEGRSTTLLGGPKGSGAIGSQPIRDHIVNVMSQKSIKYGYTVMSLMANKALAL